MLSGLDGSDVGRTFGIRRGRDELQTSASKPVMHRGPVPRLAWAAVLFGQIAVAGCGRDRAEAQQIVDHALGAYQHLGPMLAELQGKVSALHDDVETLAAALPAGGELRARYFTTEEILGVIDAKLRWLAGEIEGAKESPGMARALAVRDALARTRVELDEVSKAVVELVHESGRLQRTLALMKTPERFGAFTKVLATGVEIKGADDGAEAGLSSRIESHGRRTGWVDFDRVFFIGQSEEIDLPASRAQLDSISEILKANPSVKLEIGGYPGQPTVDERLPRARARAVTLALVQMGVSPARLRAVAVQGDGRTARAGVGLRVWTK